MKGITITQNTIHIKIDKPLYGSCVAIRDKWINLAKRDGKKLVIESNGLRVICTPKEWMKDAEKIERVFLIPDKPMVLFSNHLTRFVKKEQPEEVSAIKNLAGMPKEYRLQIRAKLGLI